MDKKRLINYMIAFLVIINLFYLLSFFVPVFAGEGHENCLMCHKAHTARDIFLFPEPIDTNLQNPYTKKEIDKVDALCMKCHANPPYGKGIRVIDLTRKHPFGIDPVRVKIPDQAKGFGKNKGTLNCMGCHDPHPSNENLGYLRVSPNIKISKPEEVFLSCSLCHPDMGRWLTTPPRNLQVTPQESPSSPKKGKPDETKKGTPPSFMERMNDYF